LRPEQRVVLNLAPQRFVAPILIPTQESSVRRGKVFGLRRDFCSFPVQIIGISFAKKPPAPFSRFKEHTVAAWIGRAIGDTMLNYVNIDSGTLRFVKAFFPGAFHYLFDGEIAGLGAFSMQKSRGNPDFISDFNVGKNLALHRSSK
jgi:hypothetical protein